jgi:hypothetical protein
MTLRLSVLCAAAAATLIVCDGVAHAQADSSLRLAGWTGDRRGGPDDNPVVNFEMWLRNEWKESETLSFRAEGWAALDPIGDGDPDVDVREGYVSWRPGDLHIKAGRQVFAWGKADRLNPTDVMTARDMRRLVEDEEDNRLGIAALTVQRKLGGGELSLIWAPEFRATELPQNFEGQGFPVRYDAPSDKEGQYAARYERFGSTIDWSVTLARVADRTPWLSLRSDDELMDNVIGVFHPAFSMVGADMATTIGDFGVRAEMAAYDYDDKNLRGSVWLRPAFALALGADRDLPGQVNVNAQLLWRHNEPTHGVTETEFPFADINGVLHYAWQEDVTGGLVRVRKLFDADRGSIEGTLGGFDGGGNYLQLKFGYAIGDGIRFIVMAENFGGPRDTQLGRLRDNSLISIGLRVGY